MDTVWYHALVSCLTIFHPIYQANLVLGVGAENIRVTYKTVSGLCNAQKKSNNIPASRIDMTEQRKSFPQAVPSSIFKGLVDSSPKPCSDLFSEPALGENQSTKESVIVQI